MGKEGDASRAVVQRLAAFFTSASIRLSEIMAKDNREPEDDEQRSA